MFTIGNKHYAKLNAEQKYFIDKGTIDQSMSARKWIRFLEPICQYDEQNDSARIPLIVTMLALGFYFFRHGFY